MGLVVDHLTAVMLVIVTTVSFLVQIYTDGYMAHDKGYVRFYAYLSLFSSSMLGLVVSPNLVQIYIFWELVGMCSYLLIGFWYDRQPAADACQKAFVTNRVGDFGLLLGLLGLYWATNTFDFVEMGERLEDLIHTGQLSIFLASVFGILVFMGPAAKSAQFPLHVWLPDAMEGPTPISALIHAATMVTAGVYLVARCSVLYALAPVTMEIIAIIGLLTALFAATMGLTQNGIKKVLAYSTISQLGYMFLALGVGAFGAGIFHVMTHAFFKALLFLCAGSVIHALRGEEDIQKMGGLKTKMRTTYFTFVIACLAICGIPPFSGFFSKDEILWMSLSRGTWIYWVLGWFGAGLTAFYMFRLVSLTFEGANRWEENLHPHESPRVMTIPLVILAILSIVGGFVGIPASLGGGNAIEHWLEPVFMDAQFVLSTIPYHSTTFEYVLMVLSVGISILGINWARYIYLRRCDIESEVISRYSNVYRWVSNKYYIDEFYNLIVVKPIQKISESIFFRWLDVKIIDGAVNGTAEIIKLLSQRARQIQNGIVQGYAMYFVVGIIIIIGYLLFW